MTVIRLDRHLHGRDMGCGGIVVSYRLQIAVDVRRSVSEHLPGSGTKDASGVWTGFSVDSCRALAAAIFDDPSKVVFTPLTVETGFAPLVAPDRLWTGGGLQYAPPMR